MPLVKICPSCSYENNSGNIMCDRCMADISGINPIDTDAQESKVQAVPQVAQAVEDSSATVIERKRTIKFVASDGSGSFCISGDAIIGREAEGREYLSSHMTVSRRHARLTYNSEWNIEDVHSSNGTYVNERRLENGEKAQIKSGDKVSLSKSCTFNIIELRILK